MATGENINGQILLFAGFCVIVLLAGLAATGVVIAEMVSDWRYDVRVEQERAER